MPTQTSDSRGGIHKGRHRPGATVPDPRHSCTLVVGSLRDDPVRGVTLRGQLGLIRAFFQIVYLIPITVGLVVTGKVVFYVAPPSTHDTLTVIFLVLGVGAVALTGYRARFSADAYGNRDTTFTLAHENSKPVFRLYMSYIPVVGRLFRS